MKPYFEGFVEGIFVKDNEVSRTNKMVNTFLDVAENATTDWGIDFIQTNTPKVLDRVINTFKEKMKVLIEKEPKQQQETALPSMGTFLKGIECGEWRKEMAMIYGMKKAGLDGEQIQQILNYAQKAWEPKEVNSGCNSRPDTTLE